MGLQNLTYVLTMAILAVLCETHQVLLVTTSFVHNVRIALTLFKKDNVDFGVFKRDVLFYKAIATVQLLYFIACEVSVVSLADICLLSFGYGGAAAMGLLIGTDQM